MAKRRLNRRQAWRVNKIQQDRIARAEKKTGLIEQQLRSGELAAEQRGLVIAHFGSQVEIEALEGPRQGSRQRAHVRANIDPLVTGDKVIWRPGQQTGIVVARLQRRSELSRPDPAGNLKPVAANIDHIIVVIASRPQPHALLVDRYLVAARNVAIEPILLLNKLDLIDERESVSLNELLDIYPTLGYQLLKTSTATGQGIEELRQTLAGKTSVFAGQSGVGKSSLINALLPDANSIVGELSAATGKGRHTTTTAKLFHFPSGGDLIDSPGIRDFGLWHMNPADIAAGFSEFGDFLGRCKFRDCRHQNDPGCALVKAVEDDRISQRRLNSYHHLVASIDLD